jgi:hypothetical protein
MNPAVRKLLAEREAQGLPRYVEDDGVLARVAALLDSNKSVDATDGHPRQVPAANNDTGDTAPDVQLSA